MTASGATARPTAGPPEGARYRLRDALLRGVLAPSLFGVRAAPRFAFRPLVRALAALHPLLLRRDRRILLLNLEKALGYRRGSSELRLAARRVVRNQIALSLETLRGLLDSGAVEVEGRETFDSLVSRLLDSGRGFLLVTGHLGSWELLARETARASGGRFHLLAKRARSAPVTELLARLRERGGGRVLWIDSTSLLRDMLSALRRGDGLGFAMDQKPRAYQGPVVDFFGYPTELPSGPAALAERTGAPVFAAFCVRTAPFRYRLVVEELLPPDHGRTGENELTQLFAHAIERAIRRCPDQWTWSYRRWLFEGRRIYRVWRSSEAAPRVGLDEPA